MVNYKNSKIYKIWSPKGPKIYIGSTTKEYLSQRMDTHRYDYKSWKRTNNNYIRSFVLFEEYGVENCFIELLEAKECNNLHEKLKLENEYISSLSCINKKCSSLYRHKIQYSRKEELKYIRSKLEWFFTFKIFLHKHFIITKSKKDKVIKSTVWITYRKFIDDGKIAKAMTKGKLYTEISEIVGPSVKNSVNYFYGLSLNTIFNKTT
jgi:hypothetical protein